MNKLNIVGQKFNNLYVLEEAGNRNGDNLVKVRCDCGVEKVVRATTVKTGRIKSCGSNCRRRLDLKGLKFGRLLVIDRVPSKNGRTYFKCLCDCGKEKIVSGQHLSKGTTISCGCFQRETASNLFHKHGKGSTNRSPEYTAWCNIKSRVNNPNSTAYKDYGGRGISMYKEWEESFQAFFDYIGPRPSPLHSIDRINPDGDYCPGNVRWADKKEQRLNQRPKIFLSEYIKLERQFNKLRYFVKRNYGVDWPEHKRK